MHNLLELPDAVTALLPWISLGLKVAAGILGVLAVWLLWRTLARLFARYVAPRPVEDVLTIVAASIATGVSAQGMWRFSGDVLQLPFALRLLLFAFIEVAIITSAVRARRNMRENYAAGIDGIAVWALTCLTAVLSSMDAHSLPEAVFRLAAPLVAAWLWERGMAIERHRIRGTGRINWRLTPERVMVRLGLAESSERTAGEVDAHRRLTRVALAIKKVKALQQAGATERKIRRALSRLHKAMDQAVEHAGLAVNETRQKALLAQIDALYSTEVLVNRRQVAKWADPQTQEDRDRAEKALDEMLRFDTAEATQRAVDRTAMTLMALSDHAASQRVTSGVNGMVTEDVIFVPAEWQPQPGAVTPSVSGEVTVERVTNEVTFDVTDATVYDLGRSLSGSFGVTPLVTPAVTRAGVTEQVTADADEASKTKVMRAFWDEEVAQKRYPLPVDLARHAGADRSLASRLRAQWVDELSGWDKRRAKKSLRDKASA